MQHYTFAEALERKGWEDQSQCVYVYRHHITEAVLYVGQTVMPFLRLRQHLSTDREPKIGGIIKKNLPEAYNWIVEIYSVAECEELVQRYRPQDYETYQRCQQEQSRIHHSAHIAEMSMIVCYQPLYNYRGRPKKDKQENMKTIESLQRRLDLLEMKQAEIERDLQEVRELLKSLQGL